MNMDKGYCECKKLNSWNNGRISIQSNLLIYRSSAVDTHLTPGMMSNTRLCTAGVCSTSIRVSFIRGAVAGMIADGRIVCRAERIVG
jgi:hypothetical protein